MYDSLAVIRLREKVYRRDRRRLERSVFAETGEVARQRRRIAGYVGDVARGGANDELDGFGRKAGARGVDHEHVGIVAGEFAHRVASDRVDVVESSALDVAAQVTNGGAV